MGFYYEQPPPGKDDDDSKPGCLDALVISKVVLQVLFWPIAIFFLVIVAVGLAFYLYTIHPALVLIPVAVSVLAIYLFARWDQNRDRPPDLPPY
jgi:hypothetical protein